MKRYPRQLAYIDYVKYCRDENYMPYSNIKFGLKLKSVVDVHKTTKDYKTLRYNKIKDDVKAKYGIENDMLKLDDDIVEMNEIESI
jgi:hypothetical protein